MTAKKKPVAKVMDVKLIADTPRNRQFIQEMFKELDGIVDTLSNLETKTRVRRVTRTKNRKPKRKVQNAGK